MLHLYIVLIFVMAATAAEKRHYTRADFPPGFVFGCGTSAYQYEGAAFEYGRKASIWDTSVQSGHSPGDNGGVWCDGYHKYKDDMNLMSEMGIDAFRFSISWSRLIPNGRGSVNPIGLQYYNDFINELLSHGIQPHVTLHHYDLPQALQDEYGGWLSRKIVNDFAVYAEICFREFGDRVKFWTTVNEANIFSIGGYSDGATPPSRCSPSQGPGCVGNSSTEPYLVMHNILLAHSTTWTLYRDKFKATQKGNVGLNIFGYGINPSTDAEEDLIASQRARDFYLGWVLSPLAYGRYPESVRNRARGRIPVISESESKQLKGSFDFIGVNHYATILVKNDPSIIHDMNRWDFDADVAVKVTFAESKEPTTETNSPAKMHSVSGLKKPLIPKNGFPVVPSGFLSLLEYIKDSHGNPPIYIHENGQSSHRDGNLNDTMRVEYLNAYIGATLDAIRNGSNIKGYMTWTLLDCYELFDGYGSSFGFYYIDLNDKELKRYKKVSAEWYSRFLKGSRITSSILNIGASTL